MERSDIFLYDLYNFITYLPVNLWLGIGKIAIPCALYYNNKLSLPLFCIFARICLDSGPCTCISSKAIFQNLTRGMQVSCLSQGSDINVAAYVQTFTMTMPWLETVFHMTDPNHYNDVIMNAAASQMTNLKVVTQPFIQAQIKENIKTLRRWPLCGGFTGDRCIPRTKGQ